jgi:hypothetical protein
MGNRARKAFYRYFAETQRSDTLHTHMESIVASGEIPVLKIGDVEVSILPIEHASGRNPHFYEMLNNVSLVRLIQLSRDLLPTNQLFPRARERKP